MISILNFLNLLNVLLSLLFQVLLVRAFGAGIETDIYYLVIGVIQFVNVLYIGFIVDLYIPIYNDVKVKNEEEAKRFTGAVFILLFTVSVFFTVLSYIFATELVRMFATGFTPEKIASSVKPLKILCISIVFSSLTIFLNSALQANLFLLITYLTALITPLFNVLALLFFSRQHGIEAVIYSIVVASILNFLILLIYYHKKIGWKFSNPFVEPEIANLLKQNLPVRAGSLLYLLKGPIYTNFLSFFPTGYITLVSYVNSILNILIRVTNSPSNQILYVRTSILLSKRNFEYIKEILYQTIMSNTILFIGAIIPVLLVFKKLFGLLFVPRVTLEQISSMFFLFIAFVPLYLILSFEVPFSYITVSMKKGLKILQINAIFLIIYALLLFSGKNLLGIYTLPLASFLAQFYNTFSYARVVENELKILDSNLFKTMGRLLIFIAVLLVLNTIISFNLYVNLFMILIFVLFLKKDIIRVLQFLTRRGIEKYHDYLTTR